MKKIGPGGVRWQLDRVLRVRVTIEKPEEWTYVDTFKTPEVLPDPRYDIRFELIQEVSGLPVRTVAVQMSCRYKGDDDRAREELLASRQMVSRGISSDCHLWDESDEPVTVVLEDFSKIMPWLFPNMDLNEFFQQTQNQNDKPLRIPAKG